MGIKRFIQKCFPYLKYVLFAWIAVAGMPKIYIEQFGEYVSVSIVAMLYFAFCLESTLHFERDPIAKKDKWLPTISCLLDIEAYFFIFFTQYHFISSVLIVAVGIAAVAYCYLQMMKSRPGKARTARFKRACKNRSAVLCAYLFAFLLLIPAGVGVYREYAGVLATDKEMTLTETGGGAAPVAQDEKALFGARLSAWNELSIDERFELLYEIGMREEQYLGMDGFATITVSVEKMYPYTLARYSRDERSICINVQHLQNGGARENVDSMLHEVFHAYQDHVVSSLDFSSDMVLNSYYYADAREWKRNMDNYKSGMIDFDAYEEQKLESDARDHAAKRVEAYLIDANG